MSATMRASRWPVTITCNAPLHHGAFGADTGNAVPFRRLPLTTAPQRAGVPVLSGNALRGAMRRQIMRELFAACELSRDSASLTPKQWDRLYAALANGGHLTGAETRADPAARLALRDALPALSVFGAALYAYLLPGKVSVGWCWPASAEAHAAGLTPAATREAEESVTEISLVRHVDRELQDPAASGVTPMPVTLEALTTGVTLHSEFVALTRMTDVEIAVVGHALDLVTAIGGKTGVGFGRVTITHPIDPTPYVAWLADAAQIARARDTLLQLAADCAVAS
jgi:hypothetical protein